MVVMMTVLLMTVIRINMIVLMLPLLLPLLPPPPLRLLLLPLVMVTRLNFLCRTFIASSACLYVL